jgi:hypothetical protein
LHDSKCDVSTVIYCPLYLIRAFNDDIDSDDDNDDIDSDDDNDDIDSDDDNDDIDSDDDNDADDVYVT